MATKYSSPLEAWKAKKAKTRPTDVAIIHPPKPRKERPAETYQEFLARVWRQQGYRFTPTRPGDVTTGTCPFHGRVRRVYSKALTSHCLECYPELDPQRATE